MIMTLQPEPSVDRNSDWIRQRVHEVLKTEHENRLKMAELFCEVHERQCWREWGHASFVACIRQEWKQKPRTVWQLMKVRRTLIERLHLPAERVRDVEWSKAALVADLLTPENVEAILADVRDLRYRTLKAKYFPPKAVV